MATVLLVDDDLFFIRVLGDLVKELGHLPVVARDGAAALAAAEAQPPDLIISDLIMRPVDGFELCRRLRERPALAKVPVILMSAKGGLDTQLESAAHGAVAFMEKPFEREELVARIKNLLKPPATPETAAKRPGLVGDLAAIEPHLLLQGLNLQRKSGRLTVDGEPEVSVWMEAGEIHGALAGEQVGEAALRVLMRRRQGRFVFEAAAVLPPERTVESRFVDLMLRLSAPPD